MPTPTPGRSPATIRPLDRQRAWSAVRRGWPAAAVVAVGLVLYSAARVSAITVILAVDGQTVRTETHVDSVADLLVEQAVLMADGDLVRPGPRTRLVDDATVVVRRAKEYVVRADGSAVVVRSLARHPGTVVAQAGVLVRSGDGLSINGRPWAADRPLPANLADQAPAVASAAGAAAWSGSRSSVPSLGAHRRADSGAAGRPWVIAVHRSSPVTIVDDGVAYRMHLAGPSVGDALSAAGVPLRAEDGVHPPRGSSLEGVTRIDIGRAIPFDVDIDGEQRQVMAYARTVGQGLASAGLTLGRLDYADPPADARLEPGSSVRVVRVDEELLDLEAVVPFDTDMQPDAELELDQTVVVRSGQPGRKRQRVRVTYENGAEIGREVIEEQVLEPPVTAVVQYGTRIVWRTVDTPEGPKQYWRKLRAYATSYSLTRSGTPPSAPWYGLTRSGLPMRKGIVGINRRVINWMSNLYVPGYGIGLAADTGGGIGLYHVDLGYDDDNYESWHWWVDVYLLEPLPPESEIKWVLP